jgi:hypothetical protein
LAEHHGRGLRRRHAPFRHGRADPLAALAWTGRARPRAHRRNHGDARAMAGATSPAAAVALKVGELEKKHMCAASPISSSILQRPDDVRTQSRRRSPKARCNGCDLISLPPRGADLHPSIMLAVSDHRSVAVAVAEQPPGVCVDDRVGDRWQRRGDLSRPCHPPLRARSKRRGDCIDRRRRNCIVDLACDR